jgi:hypothetical protein
MVTSVRAQVTLTVELSVKGDNWDNLTTMEQVHREASQLGIERITKLCDRWVRIIGRPKVEAIITEK